MEKKLEFRCPSCGKKGSAYEGSDMIRWIMHCKVPCKNKSCPGFLQLVGPPPKPKASIGSKIPTAVWGWLLIVALLALGCWRTYSLSQTPAGRDRLGAEDRAWDRYAPGGSR